MPLAQRRAIGAEDVGAKAREIGRCGRDIGDGFDGRAHRRQRVERKLIAVGGRDEHVGRLREECGGEFLLRPRIERHVEQQHWQPRPSDLTRAARAGREPEQRGAIVDARTHTLLFDASQ